MIRSLTYALAAVKVVFFLCGDETLAIIPPPPYIMLHSLISLTNQLHETGSSLKIR
jgi:hypothetical protein